MKKLIAIILLLAVTASMAACKGENKEIDGTFGEFEQEKTDENSDSSEQDNGDAEIGQTDDRNAESLKNENVFEDIGNTTESNELDTSETGQPPVDSMLKPANAVLTESGEEVWCGHYEIYTLKDATFQDVIDYETLLEKEGFYVSKSPNLNYYDANAYGISAEVTEHFEHTGTDYIRYDFAERAADGIVDHGDFSVKIIMRDLSAYNLPDVPDENWVISGSTGNVYFNLSNPENCDTQTRLTIAKDYVEKLKEGGYDQDVTEYPEGRDIKLSDDYKSEYYFMAYDKLGNKVTVEVVSSEGTAERYRFYNDYDIYDWSKVSIDFRKADR